MLRRAMKKWDFFLGVSGGILGTCFLHTTGHTPTGQWDHAALRTEHMNNKMKWFAFIRRRETTEQTRTTHCVVRGRYTQYTMYEELPFTSVNICNVGHLFRV